jgi:hypothetical protein
VTRVALVLAGLAFAATPPSPAVLVLHRADVGRAFTGRGQRVDNANAARGGPPGLAARLARWGRVDGYDVEFFRSVGPATLQDGPVTIESSASVYAGRAGAHAAFAYTRQHLVPAGYVPLALGFTIGVDARQWVRQGASGLGTLLQYLLVWREGRIVASIVVTGRVGVVSAADVAPLARRQDARIRAAE